MIVVVAGSSGTGKSTVGTVLATRWAGPSRTPTRCIRPPRSPRCTAGEPLTDADRWPWLERVAAWMDQQIAAGESAVLACSVLKRSYRDYLYRGRPAVRIVILHADPETLAARLAGRRGHFFPAALLLSQLADLEMPGDTERTLVVPAIRSPAEIADEIIRRLGLPGSSG